MLALKRSNGYYVEREEVAIARFVWPTGTVVYRKTVTDEGVSNEGVSNEGVSDEGVSIEGVSDEGVSNVGVSDEGVTEKEQTKDIQKIVSYPIVIPQIIIPAENILANAMFHVYKYENNENYNENYDETETDEESEEDNQMDCDYFDPETFWGLTWENVKVNQKKVNELTKEQFDMEHQCINHKQRMLEWEETHCRCRACQDFGVTCCLFFPDHGESRQVHKRRMAPVFDQLVR